jgi:hypothetical protein
MSDETVDPENRWNNRPLAIAIGERLTYALSTIMHPRAARRA